MPSFSTMAPALYTEEIEFRLQTANMVTWLFIFVSCSLLIAYDLNSLLVMKLRINSCLLLVLITIASVCFPKMECNIAPLQWLLFNFIFLRAT